MERFITIGPDGWSLTWLSVLIIFCVWTVPVSLWCWRSHKRMKAEDPDYDKPSPWP